MRWLSYTFQISMIVICLTSSTRLARAQDQPSSPPAKPAPSDEKPADVAGTWSVSTETPNGTFTQTLTLKQNGGTLSGTISGEKATSDLTGTVNGNTRQFLLHAQRPTRDDDYELQRYRRWRHHQRYDQT